MSFHSKKTLRLPLLAGLFSAGFLLFSALYIYGINEAALHAFGKEMGEKQLAVLENELRILETERAHLAVGSWLEMRAHYRGLVTAGPVHFVSNDTSVARAE